MDTKILESVGFTKGEIKVYLSLLELGETTTGPVIKKSRITGSKVYEILDRLIKKGLVSYIIKGKTKYFQPASPNRLMDYVNKRENELVQQKNKIKNIIPSLELVQKSKEKIQSSEIFEGYEGVKAVFSLILESLKPGEEYYALTLGEELEDKNVVLLLRNYHRKRIDKKIRVKLILTSRSPIGREFSKFRGMQIRYYPNPIPLGVFIFKDYVATFTFKESPTVFLIKSKQVSNSYKRFFEGLWKIAKN